MKILFLDFDGVLNDHAFYEHVKEFPTRYSTAKDRLKSTAARQLNPYSVQNLKYILRVDPEVRIVVSSTWRKYFSLIEIQWMLKKHGVMPNRLIGMTDVPGPGKMEGRSSWGNPDMIQRGDLCLQWAEKNGIMRENFVCVDDDNDFDNVRDRFIQTNQTDGLTRSKANDILKLFGHDLTESNLIGRN